MTKRKKVKVKKKKSSKTKNTEPMDLASFEGLLSDMFGDSDEETPLRKAQDIMYDAWEISDPKRRIALARRALEISPDCADAYALFAEETASSLTEALNLYRQGVEAGERALGKDAFEEDVDHFWSILETRPYMRARAGLAECCWASGRHEEAIQHYKDMLRLNPNDNQGIRDLLMPRLIEMGRDEEAEVLFKEYQDDGMASWIYSRALLDFRKIGDSEISRNSLKAAVKKNNHIPAYLLGRKKMPQSLPDYYSPGAETEAVFYVKENLKAWEATPRAFEWLLDQTK
ncbi:MAG: tetratricopeptide repeat protein [Thermodesulfobacteriota bacterium]|nr:tetratricopeptide repeat protein [Thermodesulfobacteriota bacterium]